MACAIAGSPSGDAIHYWQKAQLLAALRSSKLGDRFAAWVENNWIELLSNPRPRVAARRSGGGQDHAVFESRPKVAKVAAPQPKPDPPTFSGIDFEEQAATLVAAVAQGMPFCPI